MASEVCTRCVPNFVLLQLVFWVDQARAGETHDGCAIFWNSEL
ncbi:hypothetical protein OROMI_005201 [Orobanche minor]